MIRKTAHYSGHVQGVNFRATARGIARGHPVTGYVKNLSDGRVEFVAEGEEKDVDAVLNEVDEAMSGFIRDTRVDTGEASGEFDSFGIAY